jgi:putative spermidine/putrescine transport system permease protein
MIVRSFLVEYSQGGILKNFTLENYTTGIFGRPFYVSAIKNTLEISLISSVVGMIIVFITAGLLVNSKNKLRRFYMTLLTMTSNFAGMPLAFAFISMLGTAGVFVIIGKFFNITPLGNFNVYSKAGLILIYIYFQIPMGTLLMLPAFEAIRPEWKESAIILQASPFQFWLKIGLPVMLPAMAGTFSMLFANAVSAYATPYYLTYNMPLMATSIGILFVGDLRPRQNLGSAFSLIMLLMILIMLVLSNLVKRLSQKGGRK